MVPQFCVLCLSPRATNRVGRRAAPKRGAQNATHVVHFLDHRFENDGRALVVTAKLSEGWRKERRSPESKPMKTYCFSEVADAQWQGGTIHIQVSAFPRPGGVTQEWATPPTLDLSGPRRISVLCTYDEKTGESGNLEISEECFGIQASDGVLILTLDLLDRDGGRPRLLDVRPNVSGNAMFERIEHCSELLQSTPYSEIEIQFRATFKPPKKPAPVEYSFWNDFLPGGRPESNRRKF